MDNGGMAVAQRRDEAAQLDQDLRVGELGNVGAQRRHPRFEVPFGRWKKAFLWRLGSSAASASRSAIHSAARAVRAGADAAPLRRCQDPASGAAANGEATSTTNGTVSTFPWC